MLPVPRFPRRAVRLSLSVLGLTALLASLGAILPTSVSVQDDACLALMPFLAPHSVATPSQREAARTCVNSTDKSRRMLAHRFTGREFLRLASVRAMIPEYNDEQRLPDGAGGVGPKAGIFASPNLGDFTDDWQFDAHGPQGVLVALVVVNSLPGEAIPSTYSALGLSEGLSCLWLARRSGTWQAIVRPGRPDSSCDANYPLNYTPPVLTVKTEQRGGTTLAAYPAVARFGESGDGNPRPLLGIKCLNAWCEIGSGNFAQRTPLPLTYSTDPLGAVKGWHDEQMLTVRDPGSGLFRPRIRAALVPVSNVSRLSPSQFRMGWQKVATLYMETNPPTGSKYDNWGLKQGANVLELRYTGSGRGRGASVGWEVRMTPPSGLPIRWTFVEREIHRDAAVPNTARFRWTILDDGIWTPCGQACCEVEG